MNLNKKQTVVLWIGVIAFIIVGFATKTTTTTGHIRLGNLTTIADYGPLVVRLLSVGIVTFVLMVSCRKRS